MTPLTERAAAGDAWTPGPLLPRLAEGDVHVWRADLHAVEDDLAELLSPGERARGGRFQGGRERILWTRSRAVLRARLGGYVRREPVTLRFATGGHGKPALMQGPPASAPTATAS